MIKARIAIMLLQVSITLIAVWLLDTPKDVVIIIMAMIMALLAYSVVPDKAGDE